MWCVFPCCTFSSFRVVRFYVLTWSVYVLSLIGNVDSCGCIILAMLAALFLCIAQLTLQVVKRQTNNITSEDET